MLDQPLSEFCSALRAQGGYLGFLHDPSSKTLKSSTPEFQHVADGLSSLPDFDQHEAAFMWLGPRSGALHSAFLHRLQRGPGAGGVRRRDYPTLGELATDGLRLSLGMGYKSALAGLWWGGGKGLIAMPASAENHRVEAYREYGRFLSELNGCYVAAEDVGTKPEDMAEVFKTTRFTTCIPAEVGGSGNPSPATARGVRMGIEALARHWGRDVAELTVAIQGLGEVGFRLAQDLNKAGCTLTVFDLEPDKVAAVLALSSKHKGATAETILTESVDVLSPCALGAILNPSTIAQLACRAVCGAANNQLQSTARDGLALQERGILYVPDFVVNRMGIVACADEQYGRLEPDPKTERHLGWGWEHAIAPLILRLLEESQRDGVSPVVWAEAEARRLGQEPHPCWPDRASAIASYTWGQMAARQFDPEGSD